MRSPIATHYARARACALTDVERVARAILHRHADLAEFVMAGGLYFFTSQHDAPVDVYHEAYSQADGGWHQTPDVRLVALVALMEEWDDVLKLTGEPMRFTATGPVVRDW